MMRPPTIPSAETEAAKELQAHVGRRIGEARRRIRMMPARLAELVGVGQSYIYSVESRGTNLTLSTIKSFADALGLRIGDLMPESETRAFSGSDVANLVDAIEKAVAFLDRRQDQEDAIVQHLRECIALRDGLKRLAEG